MKFLAILTFIGVSFAEVCNAEHDLCRETNAFAFYFARNKLTYKPFEEQVNRTLTNGYGSTPAQRHYISASQAQTVINAAVSYSGTTGVPNNIAVFDPSSQLVAFLRMDNAYLGSVDISMKKAKTVTYFNGLFPSYGLLHSSQPGGDLWAIQETNDGLVVFGGGQPIYDKDGYFIGAVGVSGGTVQQDIDTSVHAAESIGTTITM